MDIMPSQIKTDIDTRVQLGLSVGMISAFFIGMAFLGLLSSNFKTKNVSLVEVNIEKPEVVKSSYNIDDRYLTALIINTDDKSKITTLQENITAGGDRVALIVSTLGEGTSAQNEHMMIVMPQGDEIEGAKESDIVVKEVTGFEAKEVATERSSSEVVNRYLLGFENIVYKEDVKPDEESPLENLGNDMVDINARTAELIKDINDNPDLSDEVKKQHVAVLEEGLIPEYSDMPEDATLRYGPENGATMKGTIIFTEFYVESEGSLENWTVDQWEEHSFNSWYGFLGWESIASPEYNLTFWIFTTDPRDDLQSTEHEPSTHVGESHWIHNLMRNRKVCVILDLGPLGCLDTDGTYKDEVDKFNDAMEDEYGVSQAYSLFAVKDEVLPAKYPPYIDSWPHAVPGIMEVTNWSLARGSWDDLGVWRLYSEPELIRYAQVVAHETGHVFWASDQYDRPNSTGCDATFAPSILRASLAGSDPEKTNRNDVLCDNYQRSIMKYPEFGWWSYGSSSMPDAGVPIVDWHARAQIGWGDTDTVMMYVQNPDQLSGTVDVYIDGEWFAQRTIPETTSPQNCVNGYCTNIYNKQCTTSTDCRVYYWFLPITPGTHTIAAYRVNTGNDLAIISDTGSISVDIPDTFGPNFSAGIFPSNYGYTVELGDGCGEGVPLYQCNSNHQYCNGDELIQDCTKCGCTGSDICNSSSGQCVTCVANNDCWDGQFCTEDSCVNAGTTNAFCSNTDRPNNCGDKECGTDGCYECGTCGSNETCVSSYCEDNCSDGTQSQHCNSSNEICNDGVLTQTDCRDCGCAGSGLSCMYNTSTQTYSCKCDVDCNKYPNHACCPDTPME